LGDQNPRFGGRHGVYIYSKETVSSDHIWSSLPLSVVQYGLRRRFFVVIPGKCPFDRLRRRLLKRVFENTQKWVCYWNAHKPRFYAKNMLTDFFRVNYRGEGPSEGRADLGVFLS
jgi:hypothetical protein